MTFLEVILYSAIPANQLLICSTKRQNNSSSYPSFLYAFLYLSLSTIEQSLILLVNNSDQILTYVTKNDTIKIGNLEQIYGVEPKPQMRAFKCGIAQKELAEWIRNSLSNKVGKYGSSTQNSTKPLEILCPNLTINQHGTNRKVYHSLKWLERDNQGEC
jgi:hypothetical protein